MLHWLTQLIEGSAWAYPALLALVAMDGLIPLVPGEGAILTGSILAADGDLNVALVFAAAFAGAFAGDNAAYGAGRLLGSRAIARMGRRERSRARIEWARELIRRRGSSMIVIARFVPGGRTATTLAAGSLEMPWRRFAIADALASGAWAAYITALGYLGGNTFQHSLWKPLLLAAVVATVVTAAGELYRRLRLKPDSAEHAQPARSG